MTVTPLVADEVVAALAALTHNLDQARPTNIGFPGATDFDYASEALARLLGGQLLNNVGDPFTDGAAANQTKAMERWVVEWLGDLFNAPAADRWGYVTSGGTEGNLYGLRLARGLWPDGVVYHSDAAHPSVDKAIDLLGLPAVRIRTDGWGALDYDDLAGQIWARRERPVIIAATAGTTMTEAVDDVAVITAHLDSMAIRRRFVHVDAALSGVPLGLLPRGERPGFDFADGADAITVSGHKFIGCPVPCGVVITRNSLRTRVQQPSHYTGSPDTTISGSRSGHAPLLLWYRLQRLGRAGMAQRASASRALAAYAMARLAELEWPAHLHPHGFTICLHTPPPAVTKRWVLASDGPWSHIITMPGVTRDQVDAFVADLAAAAGSLPDLAAPLRPSVPEPRVSGEDRR